jgi:hypothetical protein
VTAPVPEPVEPAAQTTGPSGDSSGSRAASDAAEPDGSNPAVDAALAELDAVEHLDPAEQVPAYERVQKALSQTLAAIDQS